MSNYWISGIGLGALIMVGWLVQGCDGTACTLKACLETVELTFEPPLEEEGAYEFSFFYEGETVTCATSLPIPDHPPLSCSSASEGEFTRYATLTYSQDGAVLNGILISLTPPSFELSIRRDGAEISRTTHKPSYETWYPNGEACDGESGGCRRASALVNL